MRPPGEWDGDPSKTANEVITDFDMEPAPLTVLERKPAADPSTSFSASYREDGAKALAWAQFHGNLAGQPI